MGNSIFWRTAFATKSVYLRMGSATNSFDLNRLQDVMTKSEEAARALTTEGEIEGKTRSLKSVRLSFEKDIVEPKTELIRRLADGSRKRMSITCCCQHCFYPLVNSQSIAVASLLSDQQC